MTHPRRTRELLSTIVVLAGAALSADAAAQTRPGSVPVVTSISRDDGTVVSLTPTRRGFDLFGDADLAGTSMKLKGTYRHAVFNAGGLCPYGNSAGDEISVICAGGGFFHYTVAWGAPTHEYKKILAAWPGVAMMQQPIGYTTPWRITSISPVVRRIGPADGQYRTFFSGAAAAAGAGCRDMTGTQGANVPAGTMLTAASDCPETWGSSGFEGMRIIPQSVWLERFQRDPIGFRFNDWSIPQSEIAGSNFVGDLSTYGAFSDFGTETLASYGGVTPRGRPSDPPRERGFPLGIEVRYDAFKFDRASLRNGVFVRWLVVNKSQQVWGRGIDYDSLYMGVDPGYVGTGRSINNVPSRGLHIYTGGGLSGKCNNTTYPRRIPPGANEGCGGVVTQAHHITLVLKSPIGDLRNKLFTQPHSPFYSPANPKADDTITFNHWRKGGFGAQEQWSWRRNDRALFGLFSGREDLWLDGRTAADFSAGNIFQYFRYEGTNGTQSMANIRYNRSVPGAVPGYGKWDYNDDGIQDTLMLPDCGVNGCSVPFADTIAGGFASQSAGNIGNYLGVGPFALRAGDTTEFVWFLGNSNGDTARSIAIVNAATEAYVSGFLDAAPIQLPALGPSDIQLTPASLRDSLQNTEVRIRIRMPERRDDEFLKRAVTRLEANDAAAAAIRRLNPGIVETVRGRMRQNLARVLVFKSCDKGVTWTDATGKCESAATARTESLEGATVGIGWQAFRILPADSNTGIIPSHVVADAVPAGREYTYSLVSQTRALADIRVVVSETFDGAGNVTARVNGTLADALFIDSDTVTSTLSAAGPSTITVYAPVSLPAGTLAARVDTATRQYNATNRITALARSSTASGEYRMRFGNRFIVMRRFDTLSGSEVHTIVRQSVYRTTGTGGVNGGAAFSPSGPRVRSPGAGPSDFNFVASADTFTSTHPFTYSARRNADGSVHSSRAFGANPDSIVGPVKVFYDTVNATGYVLANRTAGADAYVLAVGNNLTNFTTTGGNDSALVQSTDLLEGAAWFPGFTATVTGENLSPTPRLNAIITARGDTLATDSTTRGAIRYTVVNPPNTANVTLGARGGRGGTFTVRWSDDAFGPLQPFNLGPAYAMQPRFTESLNARAIGAVTTNDPAVRATIVAGVDGTAANGAALGTRPLIAAKVPFNVWDENGRSTVLAMIQRHVTGNVADSVFKNSILFGTTGDTTRLAVPPDMWMPGDTLWVFGETIVDSTATVAGGTGVVIVRDTTVNGRVQQLPIRVARNAIVAKIVLRCVSVGTPTRTTCNPIRPNTQGATTYVPYADGTRNVIDFNRPFDRNSEVWLTANPTAIAQTPLTKSIMREVHVVPNPFVVQSMYDRPASLGRVESRILFVNVPPEGQMRIYTISGQLVKRLSWIASDLLSAGDGSPHGDLPYDLRTDAGRDVAPGLYLYVLTARGAASNAQVARGKFVVIR